MIITLNSGQEYKFQGDIKITISNGRYVIKYTNIVETFLVDLVKEIRIKGEKNE